MRLFSYFKSAISTGILLLTSAHAVAADRVVNVYIWSGIVPDSLIRQFENETHIKVNISAYDNNEIMYAKLRATDNPGYDIIMPSSYFVERMKRFNMLEKIDKSQLPNLKNLDSQFLNPTYDPHSDYTLPMIWGVTGIFYNDQYQTSKKITGWQDLWDKNLKDQLLLLDDPREIFSMALLSLGYSANDQSPAHILAAYEKLKQLAPNIKVFSADTVVSIMIDEDAYLGTAWNADTYKSSRENPHVHFVFPKEGFVIWVDTLAIPSSAPHKKEAYEFINYLLRADNSKAIMLESGYVTPNLAAKKLLPKEMQESAVAFPSKEVLKHGQFQRDPGDAALALYEKYWEEFKMGL